MRFLMLPLLLLIASPTPLRAQGATPAADLAPSAQVVGGALEYEARSADSLSSVAARFGVDVPLLARINGLPADARLALGQRVRVENPHLVPVLTDTAEPAGILINLPQRMLFHFHARALAAAYPVAGGRPSWRTPLGRFEIDERETDKAWIVPPSIQEEMRREGKPVRSVVPPGPDNPLGRYWLGLSQVACGIHSTIAPTSIYSLRTHGCIRLHPDDAAALYQHAAIGDAVRIVYEPVLLGALPDGRICLEAHHDAYGLAPLGEAVVDELAARAALADRLDRERVREVFRAREGIARDVTRGGAGGSCT